MYMKIQVLQLLTTRLSMSPVNNTQSGLFDNLRMRLKISCLSTELLYEYADKTQIN